MTRKLLAIAVLVGCAAYAAPASAQARFGLRGGITDDPDTVFFGGHFAFHPSQVPNFRIEPSFEFGIGEDNFEGFDVFTLRFNLNFKYAIPVARNAAFFPVFGPGLYYVGFQDCAGDCDETSVGVNLGAGFAFSGFAFELAAGLGGDFYPDLGFTFSYTF